MQPSASLSERADHKGMPAVGGTVSAAPSFLFFFRLLFLHPIVNMAKYSTGGPTHLEE